jgi:hypothetical protein
LTASGGSLAVEDIARMAVRHTVPAIMAPWMAGLIESSTDSVISAFFGYQGHPESFGADPIHTNATGAQVIAQLVWDTMKSNCIAQPAGSNCCAP